MLNFSCSIAIGSKEVREDLVVAKTLDQCFVIFPYGIDSIFLDISMHCIEIIEIQKKSTNILNRETILNNNIPTPDAKKRSPF